MSLFQKLMNNNYTRIYQILTGVKTESQADSPTSLSNLPALFQVEGAGRIVAVVPFGTSSEDCLGTITVNYDKEKIQGQCRYHSANGANPFMVNSDFQEMLRVSSNGKGFNISGLYLQEIDRVVFPFYTYIKPLGSIEAFDCHPEYPIYLDRQIEEGYFSDYMEIKATSQKDNVAILLVYDLFN